MRTLPVIMVAMALALGACGGAQESEGESEAPAEAAQNRHLLEAARQPLERARQAEEVSAARKGQLDDEIQAAGDQ